MAVNTKAIKRRIASVTNTKKITKAMEMVSAAKMRKAVEGALATRTYAVLARELLAKLSALGTSEVTAPLLEQRDIKSVLLVVVTSNRGLCGSFNSNVIKETKRILDSFTNEKVEMLAIGKKSVGFAKKHNIELVGVFDDISERPDFDDILPVTKLMMNGFTEKKYDRVMMVYTDYVSSIVQKAQSRQVLPLSVELVDAMIADIGKNEEVKEEKKDDSFTIDMALLEPSVDEIIETVIPRLVEIQLYQAVLESAASEHSARMLAMKNASDAAGDMIDSLTLTYNKGRQAAITQEIAEIAGGAAALE